MVKKHYSQMKLMIALSALFALVLSIMPTYSETSPRSERAEVLEEKGSLWDPFAEDAAVYTDEILSAIGDAVVNSMVGAFSPNFNVLLNLETGKSATDMSLSYDSSDMYGSFTIGSLYNYAKYVGIILATLILLFNMILCIAGQAEQIRDSPLRLIAKYILTMVMIQYSFNIIVHVVNFCSGMWTDLVMSDKVGSHIDFSKHFLDNIIQYDDAGMAVSILNITVDSFMGIVYSVVMPFIGFFLIWKLFKQFLRLFMEIAERYFVMILLLLFMPAVFATIISNHTRNIFNAYMRMFCCQVFIMMCNSVFMKIFVYILMVGGWTAGLFNYILALAFMRVCQRIDTYMLSMGLNVAQTGGGVIGAGLGAGRVIGDLVRGLGSVDRIRGNMGRNMIDHALETGDYNEYVKGHNLAQPLESKFTGTTLAAPSEESFAQQMANTPEVRANVASGEAMMTESFRTGDYDMYQQGHALTVTPFDEFTGTNNSPLSLAEFNKKCATESPNFLEQGTAQLINDGNTFDDVASSMKIPRNVKDDLLSQGVNLDDISTVKQLDQKGTAFGFYDEKGQGIGFANNGEVETYSQRADDLYAMKADNAIAQNNTPADTQHLFDVTEGTNMHHQKPLMDNNDILNVTGEDKIIPDKHMQYQAFRTGYGTDTVSCTSNKLGSDFNMTSIEREYEIKSVAAHPDILKNNRYTKVKGEDGKLYGLRVSNNSPKNERTYEKNPVTTYRENKKR